MDITQNQQKIMALPLQDIYFEAQDINFLRHNYNKSNKVEHVLQYLLLKKKTYHHRIEIIPAKQYVINLYSIEKFDSPVETPNEFSFRIGLLLTKKDKIVKVLSVPKTPAYVIPKTLTLKSDELNESGAFELHLFSFPENCYDLLMEPFVVNLSYTMDIESL
jgi:hypothetical protein